MPRKMLRVNWSTRIIRVREPCGVLVQEGVGRMGMLGWGENWVYFCVYGCAAEKSFLAWVGNVEPVIYYAGDVWIYGWWF